MVGKRYSYKLHWGIQVLVKRFSFFVTVDAEVDLTHTKPLRKSETSSVLAHASSAHKKSKAKGKKFANNLLAASK